MEATDPRKPLINNGLNTVNDTTGELNSTVDNTSYVYSQQPVMYDQLQYNQAMFNPFHPSYEPQDPVYNNPGYCYVPNVPNGQFIPYPQYSMPPGNFVAPYGYPVQPQFNASGSTQFNGRYKKQFTQKGGQYKQLQSFSCEPCNKTFQNEKMYSNHLSQHITCSFCSFSASKKQIKDHESSVHADLVGSNDQTEEDGLKAGLRIMETKEEIERWVLERKRKYPTDENIKKKAERMEVLRKKGIQENQKQKKRRMLKLMNYFKVDDTGDQVKELKRKNNFVVVNEEKKLKFDDELPENYKTKVCKYYLKGKCRKAEDCNYIHPENVYLSENRENKTKSKKEKKGKIINDSILQTLLQKDEEKEREKCLGIIDFIVETNFLENYDNVDGGDSLNLFEDIDENELLDEESEEDENDDAVSSASVESGEISE